jgi:hypothetical protein
VTARKFLFAVLAVLACFVLANIAVSLWSRRFPAIRKLDQISVASDANLLFIGNSLLDGRIDPVLFINSPAAASAHLVPLNAALGGSLPPEQYLLFRHAAMNHPISTIVIGFYDFQLTKAIPTKPYDLAGNRAVSFDRRIAAAEAESIYNFTWAQRWQFRTLRSFPLIAYRTQVWKYIELLRRNLGEVGMPKSPTNAWGRASDFGALEASSQDAFNEEALRFSTQPTGLNEPTQRVVAESKSRHIRVILLVMPASPYHRETFYTQESWNKYLHALRNLKDVDSLGFIDASRWFLSERDFADRLHLDFSRTGAFTERLAREIVLSLNCPTRT